MILAKMYRLAILLALLSLLALPTTAHAGYFDNMSTAASTWWSQIKQKVTDTLARFSQPAPVPAAAPAAPAVAARKPVEPKKAGETEKEAEVYVPRDLSSIYARARQGVPLVQIQPALPAPKAAPQIAVSSAPVFTARAKKPVSPAVALPGAEAQKPRVRYAEKLLPRPVDPSDLAFKRETVLASFNNKPLEKIDPLPEDTYVLIRGLFAWLLDRNDEALGILHGLALKTQSPLSREKALAFNGWIVEESGSAALASLLFWRSLAAAPAPQGVKLANSVIQTLAKLARETAAAKTETDGKPLERALKLGLDADSQGFLMMLAAEHAYDAKKFAIARKLAKDVPAKSAYKDRARYLAALSAMGDKNDNAALSVAGRELTDLFRTVDEPALFDATAVSLGRIHFILGNYKAAHQYLSQVSRETNLFIEAAVDNAWSLLRSGDRNHAVGNMFTLHTPYFDGAYMPESYFLQSLGYQEICQFGDALTAIKQFKARYTDSFKRLQSFNEGGKEQDSAYYDELVSYLGHKDTKLSGLVLRELGRHPEFIRKQKELNRLTREEGAIVTAFPQNGPTVKSWLADSTVAIRDDYRKQMSAFMKKRALEMEDELKFLTANVSLLEYEVFAGAGNNLSLQGAQNFAVDEKRAAPKRDFEEGKEYWPYEDEIWEDELNNFRSKMVDGCAKVRKPASDDGKDSKDAS